MHTLSIFPVAGILLAYTISAPSSLPSSSGGSYLGDALLARSKVAYIHIYVKDVRKLLDNITKDDCQKKGDVNARLYDGDCTSTGVSIHGIIKDQHLRSAKDEVRLQIWLDKASLFGKKHDPAELHDIVRNLRNLEGVYHVVGPGCGPYYACKWWYLGSLHWLAGSSIVPA